MPRKPKPLTITNPLTREARTLEEWATHLGIPAPHFEQKYQEYMRGRRTAKSLFKPPKKALTAAPIQEQVVESVKRKRARHRASSRESVRKQERTRKRYISNPLTGERKTLKQWLKDLNLDGDDLEYRLEQLKIGQMTLEEVFTPNSHRPELASATNPATDETMTLGEWAAHLEVSYATFRSRYLRYIAGKIDADTLFTKGPLKKKPGSTRYISNPLTGERKTFTGWCHYLNTDSGTFRNRLKKLKEGKMTVEEVFTPIPERGDRQERQELAQKKNREKLRRKIINLQKNGG